MKNLANCTPSEFLKQTNKIKKSVEKWLKATDIMEIRKGCRAECQRSQLTCPQVKSRKSLKKAEDAQRAVKQKLVCNP